MKALNAEIIAVASRPKPDVLRTQTALDVSFILVPGPKVDLWKAYDVYNNRNGLAHPATLIIDAQGILRWKHVASTDWDRPGIKRILDELRRLGPGKE